MNPYRTSILLTLFAVLVLGLYASRVTSPGGEQSLLPLLRAIDYQRSVAAAPASSVLESPFGGQRVLQEKDDITHSGDPYWWLNSGGELYFSGNIISTIQNALPRYDKWRIDYAGSNPGDTDDGYYPQNLLRLVSRQKWLNYRQEVYFQVKRDNLSTSDNRNESNGVFLFNRYKDGDNLYYTGVRVDGTAVIKKKVGGVYHTLASQAVWSDGTTYNRQNNPSLLPKDRWVGLASEAANLADGRVSIKLFLDRNGDGTWQQIIETVDEDTFGPSIKEAGYVGLRSDFMDLLFGRYKIVQL